MWLDVCALYRAAKDDRCLAGQLIQVLRASDGPALRNGWQRCEAKRNEEACK
jgi:hypothetical protein